MTPTSYGYNHEQTTALWHYSAQAVSLPIDKDLPAVPPSS